MGIIGSTVLMTDDIQTRAENAAIRLRLRILEMCTELNTKRAQEVANQLVATAVVASLATIAAVSALVIVITEMT
jgi:outer membrane protein OmpA-like peptidoglycan-associated protein